MEAAALFPMMLIISTLVVFALGSSIPGQTRMPLRHRENTGSRRSWIIPASPHRH